MSTLCIYGCKTYTDEPDDICEKCKGFSSIKTSHGKFEKPIEIKMRKLNPESVAKGKEIIDRLKTKYKGEAVRSDGGEKVKEKDYKSHPKCSREDCIKYVVKEGLCLRHFKEEYGHVADSKEKKAKILPPPEIKIRKQIKAEVKDKVKAESMTYEMNNLMERLIKKRDLLKQEIIKIEATFVVLHDYAEVEIPELLILTGQ